MNNLKNIRKQQHKTQREVAEKLGISYQAYAHYEKERRQPSPEQLIVLAKYFNVSIDELIGRDEITQEERAAGWRDTKRIDVTPDEDDLIYYFRELGRLYGKEMQKVQLTNMKNLVEVKR